MRVELDAPNLGALEKKYLNKAIDDNFVSTFGPFVPEFEEKFREYLNTEKAVSTQSGTAALHVALHELGIGKGDEVIVPALTFVATVNPVVYVGAKPVFVDVDARTWNIDTKEIQENITKNTKAIIPVHSYGNPCDMDELMRIAGDNNLYVIEDATESLGAKYNGAHTGTFGDLGCFSFNGNKVITTGGGGMVVGNNPERLEHIKFLANQARDISKKDFYYHPEVGFNYRMTNLEAALGLAQMERLGEFLAVKKKFHDLYKKELENIEGVRFQEEYEAAQSSRWLSCIVFEREIDIKALQRQLKSEGIPTRRLFMPITEFPPYQKYKKGSYERSYRIYERGLCLPGSTLNSEDSIRYASKTLKKLVLEGVGCLKESY